MSNYNINPVSRGLNNFFENLTNSKKPNYIAPNNTYTYQPVPVILNYTTKPLKIPNINYVPPQTNINPLPTVTYTPEILRTSFEPLNPNYNNAYYGK